MCCVYIVPPSAALDPTLAPLLPPYVLQMQPSPSWRAGTPLSGSLDAALPEESIYAVPILGIVVL